MNTSPDQVRAATRSAAGVITPDTVPPLRLHQAAERHRTTRWRRMPWIAPIVAVVAVAAIVVGTLSAGSLFAGPAHRPAAVGHRTSPRPGPAASAVPAYYVAIGNSSYATVQATATGATLARIPASTPFVGVAGAADDRTFVLDAQNQVMGPTVSWPEQPTFYLLRLTPSGAEQSLTRLAVPALPAGVAVTGLALSPDGGKLAIETDSGRELLEIRVYTLATGAVRTWSANGTIDALDPSGFTGSGVDGSQSISWAADSRTLAFDWQEQTSAGVRLLDTTASGTGLIADSRPAATEPAMSLAYIRAIEAGLQNPGCETNWLITPDGSGIICGFSKSVGSNQTLSGFLRYSTQTRTGTVADQLLLQGQSQARLGYVNLYWTNSTGTVLIGALGTLDGIRLYEIKGKTFTPLPGTAPAADAAW